MPKISTYKTVAPALTDKLIGTDSDGSPSNVTKNFLIGDIVTLIGSPVGTSTSLDANSLSNQFVTAVNTKTQVNFGAPQTNATLNLSASGDITFYSAGQYIINTSFNGGQDPSAPGAANAKLFFSKELNSTQVGRTIYNCAYAQPADAYNNVTDSFFINVNENDILSFFIASSTYVASDEGLGVVTSPVAGMNDSPSASIQIYKVN